MDVYSLQHGETLYSVDAFRFMLPASTLKLFTVAAASDALGADFRFTTRLLATGPIEPDGTVRGDLVVVGDGDPTINPRHPERWRAFDDWAADLAARGIRLVRGRLIGDDSAFAEPGWGTGWAWDDLAFGYSAPVGALQYNENQVEVVVGPALVVGERAIVTTSPRGSGLFVDHDVVTTAVGTETEVTLSRRPGSLFLEVHGEVAKDGRPVILRAAVENPTLLYLQALREALARHGIFVSGDVADIDDLQKPPSLDSATELIVDRSASLDEIIDVTLKWSRNLYAETLLHAAAPDDAPATPQAGLEVVRDTLRRWGIMPDFLIPYDGSGLSRYSYVTADSLVWLLTYLWSDPAFDERIRSALPVAGESGTLAHRLVGTVAAGRVRAKTGSMSGVRTLSGYLTTLDGETLAFAILANNFRVPGAHIDALMDRALVRLVNFSHTPLTQR